MSDKEKIIKILEELGIEFIEDSFGNIVINEKHLNPNTYNPGLDIWFDDNGDFECFNTAGE